VSRRYVDAAPDFYVPDVWRKRSENKKQGSKEEEVEGSKELNLSYMEALSDALDTYTKLINSGVCPEQARMILPQAMYTSYYVTGSLAAFARAYKLRSAPDAQKEIREVAQYWNDICLAMFPVSWLALTKGT
jgi:thymidylate synthase (FAD)